MEYTKHFEKVISVTKDGWIATIDHICPQNYNMINEQWVDEMLTALRDLEEDRSIRVIVMRAPNEGDHHFIGPGDTDLMIDPIMMKGVSYSRRCMYLIGEVVRLMYYGSKPIISALDGVTDGGGYGITLASDIIISSENGAFDLYMAVASCCLPDCGGMYGLQRLVGPQKAKYLSYRQGIVNAQEALELGLVSEVVPSEKLDVRVYELAKHIASLSPYGVNAIKQTSNRIIDGMLDQYLHMEAEYISAGLNGHDWKVWDEYYHKGEQCPPEEYNGN